MTLTLKFYLLKLSLKLGVFAVRFDSVLRLKVIIRLTFKIKSEPNQCGLDGSVGAVFLDNDFFCFEH